MSVRGSRRHDVGAVLFDLDDTLHDRNRAFRLWAAEFVRTQLGVEASAAEQDDAVNWLVEEDEGGYCPRPVFAGRMMERFPGIAQTVNEFVTAFQIGIVARITLADGAALLLGALDARSIPWGIVTNGSTEQQMRKIDRLRLAGRTRCVFISEAFGCKKPDPSIFLAAAQCVGVDPEQILFVGDHPDLDVGGAQRVGMRTAWLRRGRQWPGKFAAHPPDVVADGLGDLAAIV